MCELFDRSRKPVQLCRTTDDQQQRIASLVADLRQLIEDLRLGDRRSANRIVIASQHALTTARTPGLVRQLQGQDVFIKLRSANLDECFALLLSRQADLALAYRSPGQDHPISADFIETAVIGVDRLIPVIGAATLDNIHAALDGGTMPYIAYPSQVFFGQVMERAVLPGLRIAAHPRAETALTLAALELALVGVGVAWVPASLAAARLADGSLADLTDHLPETALEVTAVRVTGHPTAIGSAIWAALVG